MQSVQQPGGPYPGAATRPTTRPTTQSATDPATDPATVRCAACGATTPGWLAACIDCGHGFADPSRRHPWRLWLATASAALLGSAALFGIARWIVA